MTGRTRWTPRGLPTPTEAERELGLRQLRALGFRTGPPDTLLEVIDESDPPDDAA